MKIFGKEFKFNGFDVYHKGNKPTANEVGASPSNHSHDDRYYKDGSVIMNTNPFGGKRIYINSINNALFNAHKRWNVTGIIYNSDNTQYRSLSISELGSLFDGSYETKITIPKSKYVKVNITFNGGYFPGYPYGYIYMSHYHVYYSKSAKLRVYCNYDPHVIGWHEYDFTDFYNNGSSALIRVARNPVYNISQMEFVIYAKDDIDAYISQLDFNLDRPGDNEMPLLDKFKMNSLYYPLDMKNNIIKNIPAPSSNFDVANKKYVDDSILKINNGSSTTISSTQPSNPANGDVWIQI